MSINQSTDPIDSAEELWQLQKALLSRAEDLLGSRDSSKKVLKPRFGDNVPQIILNPVIDGNVVSFDGAFTQLSPNGKHYWPTVIFEMAHETVHLLDPTYLSEANFLEEGVAVEFSLKMLNDMFEMDMPINDQRYVTALRLVRLLSPDPFKAAKLAREHVGGPLSKVTERQLAEILPSVDASTICRLVSKFNEAD